MYGVTTYAYVVGQGFGGGLATGAADPTGTVFGSMRQYVGSVASDAASLLLLTSAIACTLAVQHIAARYLYSLGRDRVVFAALGRINESHGSPVVASLVSGAGILAILLTPVLADADPVKTYAVLLGLGGYGILLLWATTSAAIIAFFRRVPPTGVGRWPSVGAPLLSALGLGAVLWLATVHLGDLVGDVGLARMVLIGAGVVAAAGGLLAVWWRRKDPTIYELIGRQGE